MSHQPLTASCERRGHGGQTTNVRGIAIGTSYLLMVFGISAGGCAAPPTTIHGQVFIVTAGRENVKLGLVRVEAFDRDQIVRHVASRQQEYRDSEATKMTRADSACTAELERISSQLAMVVAKRVRDSLRVEPFRGPYRRALDTAMIKRSTPDSASAWHELQSALSAFERSSGDLEHDKQQITVMRSKYASMKLIYQAVRQIKPAEGVPLSFCFEGRPTAIANTQTDADGRFSIETRSSNLVLFAHTQRSVVDKVEDYYWLVPVTVDARQGRLVMLANDTLLDKDPLGFVR